MITQTSKRVFKKEFVSTCKLKGLKDRKVIDHALGLHMKFDPTVYQHPWLYGLPKTHKANMPMRPIIIIELHLNYLLPMWTIYGYSFVSTSRKNRTM